MFLVRLSQSVCFHRGAAMSSVLLCHYLRQGASFTRRLSVRNFTPITDRIFMTILSMKYSLKFGSRPDVDQMKHWDRLIYSAEARKYRQAGRCAVNIGRVVVGYSQAEFQREWRRVLELAMNPLNTVLSGNMLFWVGNCASFLRRCLWEQFRTGFLGLNKFTPYNA